MYDWNDLKAFLAVAREGSTLGASRSLGVNQTTVSRRIEALENALGFKLFERGQSGSRLTAAGQGLIEHAEQVERTAIRFAHQASIQSRGLAGILRVTTNEVVANSIVIPALAEFRAQVPDVQVDIISTDRVLDIDNGEVDVAIRTGKAHQAADDHVVRKLADHEMALYCSRAYAARRGVPTSPEDLMNHDLIDLAGESGDASGQGWVAEATGGKAPVTRSNSLGGLIQAVKSGLGVGPMPTTIGDPDPELLRCSDVIEAARASSWLVTRKDLKDTPRVRAFIDFMIPRIQDELRRQQERGREMMERQAGAVVPFPPQVAG